MQKKLRLWQVSVGGVSQRFVMAASAGEAADSVRNDFLRQLEVEAYLPPAELSHFIDQLGPNQRRRALAGMDGLNPPAAFRESTSLLKRLERWDREETEWVRAAAAKAPPINPLTIDRLVKMVEQRHQRDAILRFRDRLRQDDYEAPSP